MKPVLSSLPEKRRTILFAPIAFGGFFLAFLILALSTQSFLATMLIAPPLGIALAYALVGWPIVRRKDGKPWIDAKVKPWLFFVIAPILAILTYPLFGVMLTGVNFPVKFVAWLSIALAATAGIGIAYLLVGFPHIVGMLRHQAQRFPEERRPFLFFPTAVLLFIAIYLIFGVTSTRMLGRVAQPSDYLNLQVLVLLPLTFILSAGIAYLIWGFPPIKRNPAQVIEKVSGRRRPQAFLLTFLLLGVPLTIAMGALISQIPLLPDTILLPIGVLLGFSASLGIAALVWGTPHKWRRFADYKPGLPTHTRVPLFIVAILATVAIVTVVFGLAGADIFWGLLTGVALGTLLGLKLSGATTRIAARKGQGSLVPELPDRVKPLILFPTWFLTAGLVFTVLTYVLPDLVPINFLIAVVIGLAVAVTLVEQTLFQELREDRRREKEKRRAFQERRKQALSQPKEDA